MWVWDSLARIMLCLSENNATHPRFSGFSVNQAVSWFTYDLGKPALSLLIYVDAYIIFKITLFVCNRNGQRLTAVLYMWTRLCSIIFVHNQGLYLRSERRVSLPCEFSIGGNISSLKRVLMRMLRKQSSHLILTLISTLNQKSTLQVQ